MIPARMGSQRLPLKNLALLNGKPLLYFAIKAAKDSGAFNRVVVNSEDEILKQIARRYQVEFYRRAARWATSETKSDFVVYDFIKNNPCDVIAWVNPTSPLQTGDEIKAVVGYFLKEDLDSLITVRDEQVHCVFKGKPVNFKLNVIFAQTQDLIPVQRFVYSLMIWKADKFVRTFEKDGHAFFCGKVGYYPVSGASSIIIKRKEDFMLADYMMRARSKGPAYRVRYDKIAEAIRGKTEN